APLVADFAFSPDSPIAGDPVAFTPSVAGGVSPYTLSWDFGDESSASGDAVAHVYGSAGTFDVTLTVLDSGGASTTIVKSVTVAPTPLVADFTGDPASPGEGDIVTFVASATGGTGPLPFEGVLGDGRVGAAPSPARRQAAGPQTGTLT